MKKTVHEPVLLKQVVESLDIKPGQSIMDGTLGGGGHADKIMSVLGTTGTYVGFDRDKEALERTRSYLQDRHSDSKLILFNNNFGDIKKVLHRAGLNQFNGMLLDLGWSSDQMADPARGFSFMKNGPLLMTMESEEKTLTAATIVNTWGREALRVLLKDYGDERFAGKIADTIVSERSKGLITTTFQLAGVVYGAYPANVRSKSKIHPATKTFQALRMAVNDEYGAIEGFLTDFGNFIAAGGRLAVITFHSGEDRLVKKYFNILKKDGYSLVTKKPIIADEVELKENPRARSAKLRVIQKND